MAYNKLASAIYNDIVGGLRGYTSTPTISLEQLEDEIAEERLSLIKQYTLKGIIPKNDLLRTISCIPIDCKDIENCLSCQKGSDFGGTPTMHFEIPMLLTDFGQVGIEYVGSTDLHNPFVIYTKANNLKYRKYRKWGNNKPYVYINVTPNENGMCDCWVFNAPFLKRVTVIGVFKDERQLANFGCNCDSDLENMSFLDAEIKERITKKKIYYYKQLLQPQQPNNQVPK